MDRCPRQADHILIKQRKLEGIFVGVQEDDVERAELVNCPECKTTLARPCANATHVGGGGAPLCGTVPEGALLVEWHQRFDCPLCHTIAGRTKL